MAEPKHLHVGPELPSPTMHEEETRVAILEATVEHYIPEFVEAVRSIKTEGVDGDLLTLSQDAFAPELNDDEYTLLGMAVKFAGQNNVPLTIVPNNE